jgi:hypothetical protein
MTTTVAPAPVPAHATLPAPVTGGPRPWLRRPLVMCIALFLVYAAMGMAKDPRASLVSDSGGKLATIRVMDQRADLDPDLGYWAEEFDPAGLAHPMALTMHIGDKWVNVTTLPMIYAAVPLYELGGFRGILLLPMLAGVMTALGARALARRLGDEGDRAFWLVGLATPVAVYALDFWEHAPGLACMVWGVVLLLDVADGRRGWVAALGGGALFGAAATMRTEALVYAAATFAVFGVAAWMRRRRFPLLPAGAALAGLAAVAGANQVLERWALGSGVRAGRTTGTAGRFGQDLTVRAKDALVTSVGLNRVAIPGDWLLGTVIVAALAGATGMLLYRQPNARRIASVLLGVAVYGYLLVLLPGLGFVPGALTASPLAVVGLAACWRRRDLRLVGFVALGALPAVWMFQYTGGMTASWSGRYLLLSSTLLAVIGVVGLRALPRAAAFTVVLLAVGVTASGLGLTMVRTHTVADGWAQLDQVPGPLIMAGDVQVMREAGAFYDPGQQWLAAADRGALRVAVDAAARSGAERLTLVSLEKGWADAALGPYVRSGRRTVELMPGEDFWVDRYRRSSTVAPAGG